MPATGTPRSTPIVLVGSGPGEADVADRDQVRFFGRFARLGYDVYAYDQLGAGLSNRLADPAAYTVNRHVADLKAIRTRIGAKRMILMGSSWGGSLVAGYLARYPRHVAKAVLTSPAPMDYGKWQNAGSPASRLPKEQRRAADRLLPGNPRFALWYALGVVNPRTAHGLVSDHEADAYFDHYLDLVRPATVCDPAHLPPGRATGNGFYDNVFTTRSAASGGQVHVPSRLATVHAPTLIVTGGCNYVPWAATRQYATTPGRHPGLLSPRRPRRLPRRPARLRGDDPVLPPRHPTPAGGLAHDPPLHRLVGDTDPPLLSRSPTTGVCGPDQTL